MKNFLCILLNFFVIIPKSLLLETLQQQQPLEQEHPRKERAIPVLLFPPTAPTRTQWIVGIGIPLEDLLFEAMTTGYVFKAEYFLPEKAEQLRTRNRLPINVKPRSYGNSTLFEQHLVAADFLKKQTFENLMQNSRRVLSSYRWSVYKGLEGLANHLGLSGRSCVLKSICETAEIPFHYKNGMMGELMHILLTPSSSADELSEHADNEYFLAESLGRSGANCERIFRNCQKSLLDHFSNIHTLTKDLSHIVKKFI